VISRLYDNDAVKRFSEVAIPKGAYLTALRTIKRDRKQTFEPEYHAQKRTVSMPSLAPGDYIEIGYVYSTPRNPHCIGSYLSPTFFFEEQGISNERVELVAVLPRNAQYKIRARAGAPNVQTSFVQGRRVLRWTGRSLRARARLVRSVRPDDVLANVRFSVNLSWRDVARSFYSAGINETRLTPEIEQYARTACASATTHRAKLESLYKRVCKDISGITASPLNVSRDASVALAERRLGRLELLSALLSAVGVRWDWFLVNSLASARLDVRFPEWDRRCWSRVLLRVEADGGRPVWLDPTARFAPFGYLVPELQDRPALLIGAEASSPDTLTYTLPPSAEKSETFSLLDLSKAGVALLTAKILLRGERAMLVRRRCAESSSYAFKRRAQALASTWWPGSTIVRMMTDDPLVLDDPFAVRVQGRPGVLVRRQNTGYELGLPVAPLRLLKAFGKQPRIKFPLFLRSSIFEDDHTTVRLGRGVWKITHAINFPIALEGSFGKYSLDVRLAESALEVRRKVEILPQRIAPEMYTRFLSFCETIDDAEASSLGVRRR